MSQSKWILFGALALLLLPWLGETLFNTKGEPREAIVAVSMLESGNWLLPESYGSDIPYKPPFLAWLIAFFSWLLHGGIVNEFTSRLPSALAAIAMVMCGYSWARKYASANLAGVMAVVTITSFEVFRASVACRVDMVLTACMVIALYQMYAWREESGIQPLRLLGIALLLSGAMLTKGPVGTLLPCLCMGIYCLLRGDNFFKTLFWLCIVCVASMAIPLAWYYKAYAIGGDHFLNLAWEENIGRLTGSMAYDSHLNPWPYNIVTIVAGMLPWTLLVIFAAIPAIGGVRIKGCIRRLLQGLRRMHPASLFALTVASVIFIFYCIPASKRSVYLLPMYPFMAYGVAVMIRAISGSRQFKAYTLLIVAIAAVAPVVALAFQWLHPAKLPIEMMPWWRYPLAIAPCVFSVLWLRGRHRRSGAFSRISNLTALLIATYSIYLAYASAFQPMVLNAKSDFHHVAKIAEAQRDTGPVYTYISADSLLRYYTLNFYMRDQLRLLPEGKPADESYVILASPDDMKELMRKRRIAPADTAVAIPKSCDTRRPVMIGRFR